MSKDSRKKGREGKRGNFCAREARAAPEGRRETRGGEGGEVYPLFTPPICIDNWAVNFKFDFGFFNVFLLEKSYIKIALKNF